MSVDNSIPEIWAAGMLSSLKKSYVYAAPGVVNRDYEGEITDKGDTVRAMTASAQASDQASKAIAEYLLRHGREQVIPLRVGEEGEHLEIPREAGDLLREVLALLRRAGRSR